MGNQITRDNDQSRSLSIKEIANDLINKDILYLRPGSTIERLVQSYRQTELKLNNKNNINYKTPTKLENENTPIYNIPISNTPNNNKRNSILFSPIKLIDQINNIQSSPNDFNNNDSFIKLPELVIKPSFARPAILSNNQPNQLIASKIQNNSSFSPDTISENGVTPPKKSTAAASVASRRKASPLIKSHINAVAPTEIKIAAANLLKVDANSKADVLNNQSRSPLSEGSEPPSPQPKYPTFESADPSLFSKSPALFQKVSPFESPALKQDFLMPFATPKTKIGPSNPLIKTTVVKKELPLLKSAKKLSDHSSIAAKMADSSFSRNHPRPFSKSTVNHENAIENVALLSQSIINQNYQVKSPEAATDSDSETDSDNADSPGATSPNRNFQLNETASSHMDKFLNMFDAIGGAMLDDQHLKNKNSSPTHKNELSKIDSIDLPSKFEFDPYNETYAEEDDCGLIIPAVKSDSHFNIAAYHKSVEEQLRRLSSINESSVSKFIKSGLDFIKPASPRAPIPTNKPIDPNKIKSDLNPNHSIGKLLATGLGVKHKPQPYVKPLPVYDDELGGVWRKLPWPKIEAWLPAFYCCGGKVKVLGYIRLPSPITSRRMSFSYNNDVLPPTSNHSMPTSNSEFLTPSTSPPNTYTSTASPPTDPSSFIHQRSIDYGNSSVSLVPIAAPISFTDSNNLIDFLTSSECETIQYPLFQVKNTRLRNFKSIEFEPYGSIDHYGNYLNHALFVVQPKHNVSEIALKNARAFAGRIVDQYSQVHWYKAQNGI